MLAWGSDRAVEHARRLGFTSLVLVAAGCQHVGAAHLDAPSLDVLRLPYDDDGAAMANEALKRRICEVASVLAYRIQVGNPYGRVLITCAEGYNRSALVAARVLHEITGWSGDQCIRAVREQRPEALFRAAFREWAESWEGR